MQFTTSTSSSAIILRSCAEKFLTPLRVLPVPQHSLLDLLLPVGTQPDDTVFA